MARPAVLLIDPEPERLEELSHGLAAEGYEVVPVSDLAMGRRFAQGLGEALIVTTTKLLAGSPEPEAVLAELHAGGQRTLVLLGEEAEEASLPETVSFLAIGGLALLEIERRLLLVLLGREVGAEPDVKLESLVGDLAQTPLLELLRGLNRAGVSGRIELRGGQIWLERGEVVAATAHGAGSMKGVKAFCRLGRMHEGLFQLFPGDLVPERTIQESLSTLIITAIEDSLGEFPDARARLEVQIGPDFFAAAFNPLQKQILGLAQKSATLQEVLDGLPARDGEIVQELLVLEERGLLVRRDPRVQIVTDSTSDLPSDLVRAYGIAVVPLTVAFGKKVFRDRVDIQPGQFYKRLTEDKAHPVSSPPTREELAGRYREYLAQGHDVVSLHLSAKLSKTFEHAKAAADEVSMDGRTLAVVDTGQVSVAMGMLALFAARMASRGETADTIRQRMLDMAPRIHTLFVVDTLEFLAKGGRIGKARALMGSLLGIKPILGVDKGEVAAVDQVRGGRAAHPKILEILGKRVDRARPVVAGISHANAPVWADRLRALVRDQFQVSELIQTEIGPVVGANVGPGVVGACLFQPTDEELGWIAP
ncbi:MAG TPA: DegV family protein [Thermoanaerobaculia bacterium]|nr:DegV family protein [Thermoanaerobaculia bacterium]